MFLKYLKITNDEGLIRYIEFHMGLNLIVDETPERTADSGNNVGKTTLLNLISYCLGGKKDDIYKSSDNTVNKEVKDFLTETNVEVELCLTSSLNDDCKHKVLVRRNFKEHQEALREINGEKVTDDRTMPVCLQKALWNTTTEKPSFREIISRSLRIKAERLQYTLRTIGNFSNNYEYEKLHLYWFGANNDDCNEKNTVSRGIDEEKRMLKKLTNNGNNASALHAQLQSVKQGIRNHEEQREALKVNPDFETDMRKLVDCKNRLRQLALNRGQMEIRQKIISEAAEEMKAQRVETSIVQVAELYRQAGAFNVNLHHTFAELTRFHNDMLMRRAEFVTEELPDIKQKLKQINEEIVITRKQERELSNKLRLTVTLEQLDIIIAKLTELYHKKGEIEQYLHNIKQVTQDIENKQCELNNINDILFSQKWQTHVQNQLDKFNLLFKSVSQKLYNAEFYVHFEVNENAKHKGKYYKFAVEAPSNFGDGKKIGEIVCFDLAYVTFADKEKIPCLHFTLYDKLELVHGNQLAKFAEATDAAKNQQSVVAILHDKLPETLDNQKYIVLRLSETSRLFKMEESAWYKERQAGRG